MRRLLGVLALTGCLPDEVSTNLAELGEVSLAIARSPQFFDVQITHHRSRPCPVLGDDFVAYVGGTELSTAPGEWRDAGSRQVDMYNNSPQPVPAQCVMPWVGGFELPSMKAAVLTIRDHSRSIRCGLGDLLESRTAVPVSGTWTMSRGARVEVKWFPVADLARATFDVGFKVEGQIGYQATAAARVVDGDRIAFDVPDGITSGPLLLEIVATTPEQLVYGCGDTTATRTLQDVFSVPVRTTTW